jgi:hypothetical protein
MLKFSKLVFDGPKVLKILLLSIVHGCFVYSRFKVNMLITRHIRHLRMKVHWGFFWFWGLEISFSLVFGHTHSCLN